MIVTRAQRGTLWCAFVASYCRIQGSIISLARANRLFHAVYALPSPGASPGDRDSPAGIGRSHPSAEVNSLCSVDVPSRLDRSVCGGFASADFGGCDRSFRFHV